MHVTQRNKRTSMGVW